ncbi:MAG: hypothetical protein ACLPXB_16795 [Thiobacillaceae bacterium]
MSEDNPRDPSKEDDTPWRLCKPNWDNWKPTGGVQLREAASLACDLDPSNFWINGLPVIRFIHGLPKPIGELMDLAKASIGAGGLLKVSKSNDALEERIVSLSNFAEWAESIGFELPEEFPGRPMARKTRLEDTPFGERERTTLLTLIAALATEAGIDISKTSKAASLIEGLTLGIGARVAARTIEEHLKRIPAALEKRSP